MIYIYFCQQWEEVAKTPAVQRDVRTSREFVRLTNAAGRECGLAFQGISKYVAVKTALEKDGADEELKNALEALRDELHMENQPMIFLFHFGGQSEDGCRAATCRMNSFRLAGATFLAVSHYNSCPAEIWKDNKLCLPEKETLDRIVEEWSSGESPNTCHLRGIALLCQALLERGSLEAHPEATTPQWWREIVWGKGEALRWTQTETDILASNGLLKAFCQRKIGGVFSQFSLNSTDLKDVVAQISKNL
ncbi:MAG: hypothetical protein IKO40_05365 [Kiritimatiellae bacterium]|nr:hypothetical protein [Kiritimatiellia bacterium]